MGHARADSRRGGIERGERVGDELLVAHVGEEPGFVLWRSLPLVAEDGVRAIRGCPRR